MSPFSMIEDVDEAGCALLGYSKDELVGLHGSELIPPAQRPAVAVSLDRIRQGDSAFAAPGILQRKDGSLLHVDVSARKLPADRLALILRPRRAGG